MRALSDKLSDLSFQVGDIEARAEALLGSHQEFRDRRVEKLRSEVARRIEKLEEAAQAQNDDLAKAWQHFCRSFREKAMRVKNQIEARQDAASADQAERRAGKLELNALLAIEHALMALEDAELSAAEAIDARIHADSLKIPGID